MNSLFQLHNDADRSGGRRPCNSGRRWNRPRIALCLELSDRFLPPGVFTVEAIVGRPLTPMSVSDVARAGQPDGALRMSTTAESHADHASRTQVVRARSA